MKQLNIIIQLAIIFLLLSGCTSNETPSAPEVNANKGTAEAKEDKQKNKGNEEKIKENLVPELKKYETIVLEDKTDNKEIMMKYPKFSYAPLDEIISSEMEANFESHKTIDAADEIYGNPFGAINYSFTRDFEKPIITKDFVSIYFDDYVYMGGAHGHPGGYTINFDLQNERIITIQDVMKEHSTSLKEMADLVAQKLIHDKEFSEYRSNPVSERYIQAVLEETTPMESNYSTFTLTEESITFYKQYYSIFPNAAGIVGVEITWDEVENYEEVYYGKTDIESGSTTYKFGDPVDPETTLNYVDQEYGFSVDIPQSWKSKFLVRIKEDYYEHLPKEPSKSIVFSMVEEGKYVGDLFSIEVLEGISEEEIKEYYKDWPGFEGYIGAGNNVVLVYTRPGEMPGELYEEPYIDTGNQFLKMVEEDMLKILETISFQ